MTRKTDIPWLERDKQSRPLPGEVRLEEARAKAAAYAAIEESKLASKLKKR